MLAKITPVFLFIAFLLELLVSLSVPVIKSIYLFRLSVNASISLLDTSASGSVKFGVWGYCISAVDVSIIGNDHDVNARCSKTALGYTFDDTIASALHVSNLGNSISHAVSAALVMHPIACGLTFTALLSSLFMIRWRSNDISHSVSIATLIGGLSAAVLTTVAFLVDVLFVATVRYNIDSESHGILDLAWGNAVWMMLGATIALWISIVGACAAVCMCRRPIKTDAQNY
ncbi:pali-domain-containing protein [Obba rivulosa]|uniref:Pali-domain-containing protein n=1 Tax=Obba rivulosa TaxID=1052685 RepID=A0A8E2J586_9APHY|nr:pali-domain-containing protein [Obba rivulosa]